MGYHDHDGGDGSCWGAYFADSSSGRWSAWGLTFVSAKGLPEFCRVSAVIKSSKDSEIKFEVWMPASNWNGKFAGLGNGAMGGSISYGSMAAVLSRGYATSSTDTGHEGTEPDGSFALGHREKVIDFGYRGSRNDRQGKANHRGLLRSGAEVLLLVRLLDRDRQALAAAQRFPADYGGIVAGAPALFLTHMQAASVWKAQTIRKNPGGLVPPSKLLLIHNAVLAACDFRDGVKEGLLEDPRLCDFDPKTLQCKGEEDTDCLTAAQVTVVRAFYSPTVNPRTKALIFPGMVPGSELGWSSDVGRMYADPPDTTKTHVTAYHQPWAGEPF